jgi:hypothetical protein
LSPKKSIAMVHWGISSPCSQHSHVQREFAEKMVGGGMATWLGGSQNVVVLMPISKEPEKKFRQAYAMWLIGSREKHQHCQAGLVSPR